MAMQEAQQNADNHLPVLATTPDRLRKYFKGTGIMLIVGGSLMFALGVTAIGITARMSYVAVPVWGGVFVIVSGILGLILYSKPVTPLIMTSLISLSSVSACLSLSVVVIGIVAANREYEFYCYPLGYDACRGPYWSRVFIDSLLALDAAFTLAVCIVLASIGGYTACSCCRACCFGNQPGSGGGQNMVVYTANGTVVPLTLQSIPGAAGPVYALTVHKNAFTDQSGSSLSQGQGQPQFVLAQALP